ncbi:MAG: hypothetical protein U0746_00405 [Gemmataceae bacterium]
MRRRSIFALIFILTSFLLSGGTALALLLHHVPTFYRDNSIGEGSRRASQAHECERRAQEVWNTMENGLPWEQQFYQCEINSYFQQEASRTIGGLLELPEAVHDVRIAFDNDLIRVGFRYGQGQWSTIISVEFRVWLVAKKPNVVALELCSFRAGAIPLGTQVLLDYVSEQARQFNIDVTWYRNHGHPVALLQFQANQPRPTILLSRLEVQAGQLKVGGRRPSESGQPAPGD